MVKKKKKKQKKSAKDTRYQILLFLEEHPNDSFNAKQLAYRLGLQQKKERQQLSDSLILLAEQGKISEPQSWKYAALPKIDENPQGIIEITRFGYGFVSIVGMEEDVFIPPKATGNAFSGDTVTIKIKKNRGRGKKIEGEVLAVVQRRKTEFVGRIEVNKNNAFVVADSNKIHIDFFVPLSKLNKAKNGDKVIVKLTDWPKGSKSPFGMVTKILGKAGDHNTEIHAILEEYELPYEFSKGILAEADAISGKITEKEISKRKDFRQVLTFTIDPEDAKDFDDAISFRTLDNGHYEIGVHIADVSHYLGEGSDLDKEAQRRATSVYLVDRVVPMLPEKLSNFLCSLRPDEEKLCFSAVFEMTPKAQIISEWFGKTIIRSDRRFTYEEVQEIIETKKGDFAREVGIVNDLSTILRKQRYNNGSFSFETEEVKFKLDDKGVPLSVYAKVRKEAHMLIEDLMLLANKKVAEFMSKQSRLYPFVYRTHERPNAEKLEDFKRVAGQFGYHIDTSTDKALSKSFNRLLKSLDGKPEQNFLESLAIRTMSKAKYTVDNIGHYGLAFNFYTHFTSPIRRYPDVLVHRILQSYLVKKETQYPLHVLEGKCKYCSEKEVNAESAERASTKFKQVEYLKNKIGEEFDGVISGVIESGLFVELSESKCEGMVPVSSIDDDYYIFDESNYQVKGYNTGKIFKLGQVVRIRVVKADLMRRQLDFELVI